MCLSDCDVNGIAQNGMPLRGSLWLGPWALGGCLWLRLPPWALPTCPMPSCGLCHMPMPVRPPSRTARHVRPGSSTGIQIASAAVQDLPNTERLRSHPEERFSFHGRPSRPGQASTAPAGTGAAAAKVAAATVAGRHAGIWCRSARPRSRLLRSSSAAAYSQQQRRQLLARWTASDGVGAEERVEGEG